MIRRHQFRRRTEPGVPQRWLCAGVKTLATVFLAWFAIPAALPAHAQGLVELYELARGYDAAYLGAVAQHDAALARAAQARAGLLPTVGLSAGAAHTRQDVSAASVNPARTLNARNVGINATQPIYRPANRASFEQGKRQVGIAQALLHLAEQDLVVRVAQAYFDVLASQDSVALVRAQKTAVAEQLAFARRNFQVGTSTITDAREAQARYDLVIAQEIAADNDLQVRKLMLDQLVGRPASVPVPLAAPVVLGPLVPSDMAQLVAQADASHPSIEQALLELDVAALEVRKARAAHLPTLDATLGYNISDNPQGTTSTPERSRVKAVAVGVVFNMPLFAGYATENRVRESLALQEQSRARLDAARRSVAQATRAAFLGMVSGVGQVKALEAAEASSQVALDANRISYRVGVRINIDVLNAQTQLFQTKRDLALARYGVLVGYLKMRQANGMLAAEDLFAINAALATHGRPAVDSAGPAAH